MAKGLALRTPDPCVEVGWFAALCGDDYEFLGVPDGSLRSSFAHCGAITEAADRLGYQSILMPSSYQVGQEPIPFAAAMALRTRQIHPLVAVRMGEIHPPMLARHLSTLDHMLEGRLLVNIISSDLPGEKRSSEERYARTAEVIQILQQAWTCERIRFEGRFYSFDLPTEPVRPYQPGGPLLYFGGISPNAKAVAARFADVHLLWPETEEAMAGHLAEVTEMAREHGRTLDFGLRIHVIVRETEKEARASAARLLSRLDETAGRDIKTRAQDHQSAGTLRQDALRSQTADDYIEPFVWSGIGRARSGCASAIVGDPDQVLAKIRRYIDMGFRSLILSGYPHRDECELFARYVLPRLPTAKLSVLQGRKSDSTPETPLTTAPRK